VFKYGTQGCNSKTISRIVHESLKLGDIILTECILNPRKPNGEKVGPSVAAAADVGTGAVL
ncbi:hypothetical protein FRC00_011904, partial [Tulasnella sp. 408]